MLPIRHAVALGILLAVPVAARSQIDSGRTVPIAPLSRIPSAAWGASVWVIDSAEIAKSTAPTFSELLQARRPGVRVFRSGGTASDGALVLLRGPTSISRPSEPLVIVDGVRVDSRQFDVRIGGTSPAPSRLDDLLPEDIQQIVILSGPAAALYGDGAANGVILVTTKSGGTGPLRLSGRATWDASRTNDHFPANYHRTGVSPTTGQPETDCGLVAVSNGQCTPTGLEVWNPLEQASPFRTGNSARGHLDIGGTALGTPLHASMTADERRGTLPHDESSRLGLRGKVERALPWHLTLRATGGYLRDNARLAVDGNTSATVNVVGNGLTGSAVNDANHGYAPSLGTPGDSSYPDQLLRHESGGVTLQWAPLTWLDAAAGMTRDRVTAHWREDELGTVAAGFHFRSFERHEMRSATARVGASYHVMSPRITATTNLGLEREVQQSVAADSAFNASQPGSTVFSVNTTDFRDRSTALWVDQSVRFGERLSASAAMERLTSAIFETGGDEWFPSANVSWMPLLRSRTVADLRLRAAYAEAGGATAPLVTVPVASQGPSPHMERTKELELGADARLAGVVDVDLTAFRSISTQLWFANILPPNVGALSAQGSVMSNVGMEALVTAPLANFSELQWTASLSLALLRNRVTRLATPPTYTLTDPLAQGQPFGTVWANTYTYADANHDGIISTSEVQLNPALAHVGAPLPDVETAFTTDLVLRHGLVLSGTLDYRGGNRVLNLTEAFRCFEQICRAAQDPSAPLDQQAAVVAERLAGGLAVAGYAQNAAFMRLREIAAHWTLPARWSGLVGARAELTVAARNLATWTNYHGLDPEISYRTPDILPRQDFLTLPLPRELVVRLDVGQRLP